jgi:hypothetical protein
MRAKILLALSAVVVVAGSVAIQLGSPIARAAQPSSGTLAPRDQGTARLAYKGTVPPGTGSPTSTCKDNVNADVFTLTLTGLTSTFYRTHNALLVAHIEWKPTFSTSGGGSDLALIVRHGGKEAGSSDGGSAEETVAVDRPQSGKYQIIACAFSNAVPQAYTGTVTLTSGHAEVLPKAAAPRALRFMPLVTADPQRDLGEPSLQAGPNGILYTCAPFGASRSADYAARSTDHGDTFRVLGTPPEGRIAPGGGGDCDISVAPRKNGQGNYTLSYVGLEALANFSTGRSTDNGRSFQGTNTSQTIPVVDRQWLDTIGTSEVYLFYNEIPQGGTVQRSTDGGLTYAPSQPGNAAPNIGRPGNIVVDPNPARNPAHNGNETVYVTYTNGNKVQVSRSTNQGNTFTRFTVAVGKGSPDQLFPSLAMDTVGNLYLTWVEAGTYDVFYAFSKDHGATWTPKRLVNRRGASTALMPWVAAGSPGRIAIAFYCSSVDGNPQTGKFHGPWNVCVDQSLNALSASPAFSQVRVSQHVTHWDSICTNGLGCDTSVPPGDRSLLDFFQLQIDPRNGRLMVVFTEGNKQPRTDTGLIAIDVFAKQKSGPSLFKRIGNVAPDPRNIVRSGSKDPQGDSHFPISSFGGPPPTRYVKPMDIRLVKLSKGVLPKAEHALRIQMKVRDLSDQGLGQALADMGSQQLKFVVRWFSAYRPDFVTANWRPGQGFTFRRGHLATNRTADGKLEVYNGGHGTPGHVNRKTGVITWLIPYRFIQDFDLGKDKTAKPVTDTARPGDHIFEVTGWTFGIPSPQSGAGDYYNQADSTPSFNFRLP